MDPSAGTRAGAPQSPRHRLTDATGTISNAAAGVMSYDSWCWAPSTLLLGCWLYHLTAQAWSAKNEFFNQMREFERREMAKSAGPSRCGNEKAEQRPFTVDRCITQAWVGQRVGASRPDGTRLGGERIVDVERQKSARRAQEQRRVADRPRQGYRYPLYADRLRCTPDAMQGRSGRAEAEYFVFHAAASTAFLNRLP